MIAAPPPDDIRPPAMVSKPVPFGADRKRQMAGYSWRHYRDRDWRLEDPKAVVLHFTVSNTWQSAWHTFAGNGAVPGPSGSRPEAPGSCTHFIVGKQGKIIKLVNLTVRCRHAIGINHRSIGIEFVEPSSASNILQRRRQMVAGLRLVRWLQAKYGWSDSAVIGHSMVNDSPWFEERVRGWRNDHTDWSAQQVRVFRKQL